MAVAKHLLVLASVLFSGVVAVNATDFEREGEPQEEVPVPDAVTEELKEGERALEELLGPEVKTLDKMLRPMIHEMSASYGVSEKELAVVAKEVMQKLADMDVETLQATLSQLTGLSGLKPEDMGQLQELLNQVGDAVQQEDGI